MFFFFCVVALGTGELFCVMCVFLFFCSCVVAVGGSEFFFSSSITEAEFSFVLICFWCKNCVFVCLRNLNLESAHLMKHVRGTCIRLPSWSLPHPKCMAHVPSHGKAILAQAVFSRTVRCARLAPLLLPLCASSLVVPAPLRSPWHVSPRTPSCVFLFGLSRCWVFIRYFRHGYCARAWLAWLSCGTSPADTGGLERLAERVRGAASWLREGGAETAVLLTFSNSAIWLWSSVFSVLIYQCALLVSRGSFDTGYTSSRIILWNRFGISLLFFREVDSCSRVLRRIRHHCSF